MSPPVVISADLIAIGDQSGCACLSRAPRPATCGLDIDVPLKRLKFRPPTAGETAARMSWPGAITSGFSTSPPPASSGPRDENDAVNGAGSVYVSVEALIVAVGAIPAAYAFSAARSVSGRWTVGTEWKSALIEPGATFTRIIPTPPASWTARLLLTRPVTPRSQRTILPATFVGSRTATPALSTFP